MFRNFYLQAQDGQEFDATSDGNNSCAFYVSSVLTLFRKQNGIHGTVASVIKDLQRSAWLAVPEAEMQAGDVIIWEAIQFEDGPFMHIGFYVGDGRAVSTSAAKKKVVEHDVHFGKTARQISQVFRQPSWE